MPEFLEDPSGLTKDKLKSELLANDVSLPPGEQKKEVYVQLYKQHLTARNRATPDFSSDEERESTPMRGRGRPPGRKATKKTNKPNIEEEKNEQDLTELSNEALKEELLKFGINPGPIMGSTRKVYEKRLLKVREQQVTSVTSLGDASNADRKQNGNSDSAQYSDNEEPKIDLTFETREPIRGKSKIQVSSRSRRVEQTENISGDGLSEPPKMVEPEKVGRVQTISKESSRVARRTPRKRVVASEPVPDDDADVTEAPTVAETILPSSNQAPVDNQVTEVFKHTNSLRAVGEYSELSRRTPKKQPIIDKMVEKSYIEERREDRDVLKEMFPYEASTPTGISATCRRPIKGAAGRPLSLKDYKIEESYTTKYVSKYKPVIEEKPTNPKAARSIPMWMKILLFVIVAVFSFLVYQVMETNEGNPFTMFLTGENLSKTKN